MDFLPSTEPAIMATLTESTGSALKPYRFNVRQFLEMIRAGVLPEDAHVELLEGIPVEQMTKYPPRNFALARLAHLLRLLLPPPWILREGKSMQLGRFWRPEPDLAVIRGPDVSYENRDPSAADCGLLIEVSAMTYLLDRGLKWRRYAASRVPIYWIVNLSDRRIEVHGDPSGKGRTATYRQSIFYAEGAEIPTFIEDLEIGRIAVHDILPRARP